MTTNNIFDISQVSHAVQSSNFAVRGVVVNKAMEYQAQLYQGKKLQFDELAFCNQGDPLSFSQSPLIANRQAITGLLNPDILPTLPLEVRKRVEWYQSKIGKCGNIGAYTASPGLQFVRESISDYIKRRDGLDQGPGANNIMMTNGASEAIQFVLQAIIQTPRVGIMIPIPQYPLYSSTIALFQGAEVHYYLDEEKNWQLDIENLEKSYEDSLAKGIVTKAICVINPGNPTGSVLSKSDIQALIKFAYHKQMVILADEVYQTCIYSKDKSFFSFNKIMREMGEPYSNKGQLFSFHSASKGQLGECGLRGGYVHFSNIDQLVIDEIIKLRSIGLNANTVGQITTELMVNPIELESHKKQINEIYASMKKKAQIVHQILNSMENSSCNEIEGAMYGFAKINLPSSFIAYAHSQKIKPDVLYCLLALEKTGVVLVPGSGFGQKSGTYHFRTTILINPPEKLQQKMEQLKIFNSDIHKKYKDTAQKL